MTPPVTVRLNAGCQNSLMRIIVYGRARAIRYRKVPSAQATPAAPSVDPFIPLSDESKEIQDYVRRPVQGRVPVGYQRDFLEYYKPNRTYYLPDHCTTSGNLEIRDSTYPTDMVNRLLIDLSWASSRLEGNTYSLLDTQNLIEAVRSPQGKTSLRRR